MGSPLPAQTAKGSIRNWLATTAKRPINKWLAITVIVIAVLSGPIVLLLTPNEHARMSSCQSNLKQIGVAVLMYSEDNNEHLPPASRWCDAITPYTSHKSAKPLSIFKCPSATDGARCSYAYNDVMDGTASPSEQVLLFDATGGWNQSGGFKLIVARHLGGLNVSYADGHVKWLKSQITSRMPK